MLDINTQAQIRPYYKDNLDNDNQFVWEGLDGYGQDQNNEGDANVEQDTFEYKVLIPIASKGPNMVCWEQTDGEFKADKKVLYTLKFKEPGNVKSSEGDLYLPYVPADIYAWVQGHNLEFLGLAEVCKISPLSENTSFLIDGNNAENINTTKGFVFELKENIVRYTINPDSRTNFQFISNTTDGSRYIFVKFDTNSDYSPYYPFSQSAFGQGFDEVMVLKDKPISVVLTNLAPEDDPYLYIDRNRQIVPPDPTKE